MGYKSTVIQPPPDFYQAIREALGIKMSATRRIVIDIPLQGAPIVYVEMFADERFVKIVQAFEGIQVEIVSV